jgi:hypothetical protein
MKNKIIILLVFQNAKQFRIKFRMPTSNLLQIFIDWAFIHRLWIIVFCYGYIVILIIIISAMVVLAYLGLLMLPLLI